MASIFATTAEVQMLCGENCSATSNAAGHIDVYMSMAESYINSACGVNYSDTYAALNIDKKRILSMAAASYAAILVINYDLRNFPSMTEIQTRINVLDSTFKMCLKLLGAKEGNTRDFVSDA